MYGLLRYSISRYKLFQDYLFLLSFSLGVVMTVVALLADAFLLFIILCLFLVPVLRFEMHPQYVKEFRRDTWICLSGSSLTMYLRNPGACFSVRERIYMM
jgi:hypothetical protein